jgi:hypothetical protein
MFGRLKAYSQKEWAFLFSMIYRYEKRLPALYHVRFRAYRNLLTSIALA